MSVAIYSKCNIYDNDEIKFLAKINEFLKLRQLTQIWLSIKSGKFNMLMHSHLDSKFSSQLGSQPRRNLTKIVFE